MEIGSAALRGLGHHPFFVEQQKTTFKRLESALSEGLYDAWNKESESGERFDNNYVKLFMELEERIKSEMAFDRSDNHSRTERGWTPPPKGYADKLGDELQ